MIVNKKRIQPRFFFLKSSKAPSLPLSPTTLRSKTTVSVFFHRDVIDVVDKKKILEYEKRVGVLFERGN